MKKNIIIFLTVLSTGNSICSANIQQETAEQQTTIKVNNQRAEQPKEPVYEQDKVDKKAEFAGGIDKQMEFMIRNVKYPKEAENEGVSGIVRVHFIVEKDGSLSNIKVPESVHPALDAEGIRLVNAMPKWNPANLNGKIVRSKMILVIPFRLK